MICLARDPPTNSNEGNEHPPTPSKIFISNDYGDTFQDMTNQFTLTIDDKLVNSTVDQFSSKFFFS